VGMILLIQDKMSGDATVAGGNMLRQYKLFFILGGIFAATSAILYSIHYAIFRDVHHIFIYMVGDLAFLPLEAFIVVVVIERILTRREKQTIMQKLNMVVGAFFSELGNYLLNDLLKYFGNRDEIARQLNITQQWTATDFQKAKNYAHKLNIEIDCRDVDLEELKAFLLQERTFLLTMLENPNLLEYDRFTNLLWALSHLAEELDARDSLRDLPQSDLEHIAGDIQRFYGHLAAQWIDYVEHLKASYPFLYSLVLRNHPFQEHPSPIVA